jgi:hypothetical protein
MNLTNHLPIQEFFHPDYFDYFKNHTSMTPKEIEEHLATWVQPHFLTTFTQLRQHFGPCYLNNWHASGVIRNAGKRMRPFVRKGIGYGEQVGAFLSSHYESNGASDCHFTREDPKSVQEYILANLDKFPHVYRMENAHYTETWNHIETITERLKPINVFIPG